MGSRALVGVPGMPKKRPTQPPGERKQYNVGFKPEDAKRIDGVADALGLDSTQLLRMIVRENLAKYERRAQAIREGKTPDDQ